MHKAAHVDRLLLVWHLALWWLHALGLHVIRADQRNRFDRAHRRERSALWLGWIARGTPSPKLSG